MANKIILKKSAIADKQPNIADLEVGEVAINLVDKKIFSKTSANEIIQVASGSLFGLDDTSDNVATENNFLQFKGSLWEAQEISPVITINLLGNITGSASITLQDLQSNSISIDTLVSPNSIILSRDTVGYYIGNIHGGVGVTSIGSGEDSNVLISIGQDVSTTSNVTFNNITATNNVNAVNVIASANVDAQNSRITNNVSVVNKVTAATFVGMGQGFSNMEVKTTGTSWTIPNNVTRWKVTVVGAGGAGGGCPGNTNRVGNGGGGGAVSIHFFNKVNGVNTMTYGVGAGGTIGGNNAAGNPGLESNVTYNGVKVTAGGGGGGATSETIDGYGLGGTATGGTLNIDGFHGESGGQISSTNHISGSGGNSPLGFGCGGVASSITTGDDGNIGHGYGGGGGGGETGSNNTQRSGGPGTPGLLIIEY